MPSTMHTNFIQVMVHTAKCDTCDNHNTLIIYRCADCGIQCCTPCWQERGGDDNHVLNGGDRGWTGKKISKTGKERSRAIPKTGILAKSKPNNSGNRPKGIVKRRYVRNRKAVLNDEDETEEEEAPEEISPAKENIEIQRSERYPRRLSTQNPKTKQQEIPAKPSPTITKAAKNLTPSPTNSPPILPTQTYTQPLSTPTPQNPKTFSADERGISLLLQAASFLEKTNPFQQNPQTPQPSQFTPNNNPNNNNLNPHHQTPSPQPRTLRSRRRLDHLSLYNNNDDEAPKTTTVRNYKTPRDMHEAYYETPRIRLPDGRVVGSRYSDL